MTTLDLTGLTARPSQVWGAVRLVPLVRDEPVADLRLHSRLYGDAAGPVEVGPRATHTSYIPHGFVARWTDDSPAAAAYGTQLSTDGNAAPAATMGLRIHRRMARREARNRLRFLPMSLALEGYLGLHFGGPAFAWEEWSQRAISGWYGWHSPHVEEAYVGAEVSGLADALRVFEIHPDQCGVMVYAADALASAFVVPHPDDYRALHPTLLQDLYGELIHHHVTLMPPVQDFRARISDSQIRSLAHLRTAVAEQEHAWTHFHDTTMAAGLLEDAYTWQSVHRMRRFTLSRFLPSFRPHQENHIGEAITDDRGRIAYLKTFRLSETQVRRGRLVSRFAANDWHLANTADELGVECNELGLRMSSAGFNFTLRRGFVERYREQARTRIG
ncbi:ARPP-2 domain-containing protein [Streptomyces neyagawaensis]|uniref:ARG and Rhodanese-Phosphatase-superfamily-associated domain-containing protein n=1 Tax=Streptomyces neyagawaensis TaxID=42238 RepID=A0ABV3B7C6_9ACTN